MFSIYPKSLLVQFKPKLLYLVVSLLVLVLGVNNTNTLFFLISALVHQRLWFRTWHTAEKALAFQHTATILWTFPLFATLMLPDTVLFYLLHCIDRETETQRRKSNLFRSPRSCSIASAFNIKGLRARLLRLRKEGVHLWFRPPAGKWVPQAQPLT